MPFKIIQTNENQRKMLVIVPSMWEENGHLWWPPKNTTKYKTLMKDELSRPEKNQWKLMDCTLKRNNIRTYDLAEAELSIMEEKSDTDVNDMLLTGMVRPVSTVANEELMEYELITNNLVSYILYIQS